MGIVVDIDGTDGTGKTTLAALLSTELARRKVPGHAVPSARELISDFDATYEALDPMERVQLEARGYEARRQWAMKKTGICAIDRGQITLMTSCTVRLIGAGLEQPEAQRAVRRAFSDFRTDGRVRYLLTVEEPSEGMSLFWMREPARVSPEYFEYQSRLLKMMSAHPRQWWRKVFRANDDVEKIANVVADDLVELAHLKEAP